MNQSFSIERFGGDASEIKAIADACFSSPWSETVIKEMLCRESCAFFTAVTGDKTVGFISVQSAADEGEILDIAVLPEIRRKGIGKALLDKGISHLTAQAVKTIFLEVRESGSAARELYKNCGFYEYGRRKAYYNRPKEDAVLMLLRLS